MLSLDGEQYPDFPVVEGTRPSKFSFDWKVIGDRATNAFNFGVGGFLAITAPINSGFNYRNLPQMDPYIQNGYNFFNGIGGLLAPSAQTVGNYGPLALGMNPPGSGGFALAGINGAVSITTPGVISLGGTSVTNGDIANSGKQVINEANRILAKGEDGANTGTSGAVRSNDVVNDVITESFSGAESNVGNIKSKFGVTTDEALALGDKLLGQGYKEVGKPGSGVFEKQVGDQTYRFRIDNNSLLGNHAPNEPHVHVEILDKNRNILVNNHIPLID